MAFVNSRSSDVAALMTMSTSAEAFSIRERSSWEAWIIVSECVFSGLH